MADDWEQIADEDLKPNPVKPVVNVNKWDGEDEDEIKDSWEDDEEKKDEEKVEEIKMVKSKPKKSLAEKIAERERTKQETSRRNNEYADDDEDEDMTPAERLAEKLRLQKLQEESDLLTALDTLGLTAEKTATTSSGIDGMSPTNKAEFSELSEAISKKVSTFKSSEEFPGFLEELVQSVCANLNTTELRKIKTALDTLYNEKQKLEKASTKGKGKNKRATLKMDGNKNANMEEYGDYDYDEFM